MAGRPSKILSKVTIYDVDHKPEELPITDAICKLLEAGCYLSHAAQAVGLSDRTVANWRARGAEYFDTDAGALKVEESEIPEGELPYVRFFRRALEAEAVGITWHELNIAQGAKDDPRLSLYFLERRRPAQYGRRMKIETEEEERTPAEIDAPSAREAREAFEAAHLPEGVDPKEILPSLRDE